MESWRLVGREMNSLVNCLLICPIEVHITKFPIRYTWKWLVWAITMTFHDGKINRRFLSIVKPSFRNNPCFFVQLSKVCSCVYLWLCWFLSNGISFPIGSFMGRAQRVSRPSCCWEPQPIFPQVLFFASIIAGKIENRRHLGQGPVKSNPMVQCAWILGIL